MSLSSTSSAAVNSCIACKHGKRKCDRALPVCSTCTRVGRNCVYEDDSGQACSSTYPTQLSSQTGTTMTSPDYPQEPLSGLFLTNTTFQGVDPFTNQVLRQPTVDSMVGKEALKILGTLGKMEGIAATFFATIGQRIPIISRHRYYERLQVTHATPHADFTALGLCMHLVLQGPSLQQENSMQSSIYLILKSIISLLESTGTLSLELVQCKLLLAFYEMGHNIYPAASISIGGCARAARSLGLNKKGFQIVGDNDKMEAEEKKRVWWAVINMDRFINLCNGDALFGTEDPSSGDLLPVEDILWAQDVNYYLVLNYARIPWIITLATPFDTTVGQFARECQISHLIGRVLRHVFDPTSDPEFHSKEALQLERTLVAFIPLLIEEQDKFGLYCAALGMCCSALFLLYDSMLLSHEHEDEKIQILKSQEEWSMCIAQYSKHLFGDADDINYELLSPFIPYSLYQAAVVQYRMWKQTAERLHNEGLDSLKTVLGYFNKRWLVAGKYKDALNTLDVDWPMTTLPLQGFCISAKGPTDAISQPYAGR